jgi:hypothetical protein
LLKTVVEVFDGRATALYPEAHGGILLVGDGASVLGERHPWAHGDQS